MPAIDRSRLKIQAARLAGKFAEPEAFLHDLNEVLDFYTNRTIRATQVAQRLSAPTYHTPPPVLRQIERELAPLAENQPNEAANLTKVLWGADSLEARLLAAFLLGNIPSDQAMPTLSLLPAWLNQPIDKEIRTALLTTALTRLRQEEPGVFFVILEGWLGSPEPAKQVWGLQALIPLFQDPHFENLPAVFRILRPAIKAAGPATQLDLQACLTALERVSLIETIAFLRGIIWTNPTPMMLRIFRRILPNLSQDLQGALRETLREQNNLASPPAASIQ
ncbi:MAG: hypothetical protein ABSF99_02245 [Anaerolineales bacterium]|jgi:hypothetical protein